MMMLLRLHDDVTDVDSCLDDDRDEGDDDDKNQWVCSRRPVLVCMVILPQGWTQPLCFCLSFL